MAVDRITTHLGVKLTAIVHRQARLHKCTPSRLIADAVARRFAHDPEERAARERDIQFLSVDARLARIIREQTMIKESVLLFVRAWLEHTPPLAEEVAENAAASAQSRFERFCDYVMAALDEPASIGGARFLPVVAGDAAGAAGEGAPTP